MNKGIIEDNFYFDQRTVFLIEHKERMKIIHFLSKSFTFDQLVEIAEKTDAIDIINYNGSTLFRVNASTRLYIKQKIALLSRKKLLSFPVKLVTEQKINYSNTTPEEKKSNRTRIAREPIGKAYPSKKQGK